MRELGRGSFGVVYLGQHPYLIERYAAIKTLVNANPTEQAALLEEARKIAQWDHPNIVKVLGFGDHQDQPYLTLQYAANGTLKDRYPLGQVFPLETILPLVRQIAEGVQYAHEQRMLHLDLKPANVLLDEKQGVLVADFGVARALQGLQTHLSLTLMQGTLAYAAPEQCDKHPTFASDQYALATMVYHWLTAGLPFGNDPVVIFGQKLGQHNVPPLGANVPPAVAEVVLRGLAKDPKDRYPTMRAFAEALTEAASKPPPAPPAPPAPALPTHQELQAQLESALRQGNDDALPALFAQLLRLGHAPTDPAVIERVQAAQRRMAAPGRLRMALLGGNPLEVAAAYGGVLGLPPGMVRLSPVEHGRIQGALRFAGAARAEDDEKLLAAFAAWQQVSPVPAPPFDAPLQARLDQERQRRLAVSEFRALLTQPQHPKEVATAWQFLQQAGVESRLTEEQRQIGALAAELAQALAEHTEKSLAEAWELWTGSPHKSKLLPTSEEQAAMQAAYMQATVATAPDLPALPIAPAAPEPEEATQVTVSAPVEQTKDWWLQKAFLYETDDRNTQALHAYEEALALAPSDAAVLFGKAFVLWEIGQKQQAGTLFFQATRLPCDSVPAYFHKAALLASLQREEEGQAALEEAVRLDPHDAFSWVIKGLLLGTLERKEEAEQALEQAARLTPQDALGWVWKAFALNESQQYEEAIAALERAVALDPTEAHAWREQGHTLIDLHRYEEAVVALERALALDPDDANAWNDKGNALYDLKHYEEAVACYERASACDAKNGMYWRNRGNALKRLGRSAEAEQALAKARELGYKE
jgi:tetratricopeptide (TPR) repeat protein